MSKLFAVTLYVQSQKFISPHRDNFHSVKGGSLGTVGVFSRYSLGGGATYTHTHSLRTPQLITVLEALLVYTAINIVLNFHCSCSQ